MLNDRQENNRTIVWLSALMSNRRSVQGVRKAVASDVAYPNTDHALAVSGFQTVLHRVSPIADLGIPVSRLQQVRYCIS